MRVMRSKAAVSSTVRQFLVPKQYDAELTLAYFDVHGKVGCNSSCKTRRFLTFFA